MSGATAMRENLRQMIAVLQAERQALAGLDLDAIMGCANEKVALCGTLDNCGPFAASFAVFLIELKRFQFCASGAFLCAHTHTIYDKSSE